ncbi:hypothetical protein BDW22DRAFT_789867 [Trametopsis cervina]|nr:hypothetical protein BDW22DRAFT_789867 [Trametopsis cervina]
MHFIRFIASAAAFVAVVGASAVAVREEPDWKYSVGWDGTTLPAGAIGVPASGVNATHLEKRAVGGVYICSDVNWKGQCGYAVQQIGQCIRLGSDWNKKISSFGPDACTSCFATIYADCGVAEENSLNDDNSWQFLNPGSGTGGLETAHPWNDKISSFVCVPAC